MHVRIGLLLGLFAFCSAQGQQSETEALRRQLKEASERFEQVMKEQRQTIDQLQRRLDALEKQQPAAPTNSSPTSPSDPLAAALAADSATKSQPAPGSAAPAPVPTTWSPAQPIRFPGAGQNYLNLSFDALFAAGSTTASDVQRLQPGAHDPAQRGFTVQNLEPTFEGKIDPYFRGQATISMQITPTGETTLEAEEAYAETMALPANLQVRAGMFFTEFGRINATHAHTWDFVDSPLISSRIFGPDGLRNPGVRLSWLAPTPFYSELFFAVQNAQGSTAYGFDDDRDGAPLFGRVLTQQGVHSGGDLLFAPRYAASFNLTEAQTILAGASAAFGPNSSGPHAKTQVYGLDLFYKWKPVNHHAGFPFVSWQTEGLFRRFGAAPSSSVDLTGDGVADPVPGETLRDFGFYTQIAYGFHKGWVAALRGDYASSDIADYERLYGRDLDRARRWRLSPDLTWYPTEFSKVRLQYNLDNRAGLGVDHSVWMQFEFLLGTHAAHKF